ncbi:hypothetical protein PVBG_06149 [Plasmodium vivax Brazil I]|uniref:Variable surface protein Vir4 n=1 Tax=Plasmodium vivax (strain Brazil I) TaxID=1033975 RepID=A0A0J9SMT5_PLAV1|nr:hypothetical protein PVBG_06149 [Plasmodium vivax Brazil I]
MNYFLSFIFPFSDELNSQHFYNYLSGLTGLSAYVQKCEKLSSFHNGRGIKNTCAKLLKYLDFDTISTNKDNKYDACMLLNFWVYRRLFDYLQTVDERYLHQAYANLQLIWNDFSNDKLKNTGNETCRPIHNLSLYKDWKERKELYEYYVDYDDFSKKLLIWPDKCKEFYEYVERKKTLYNHFNTGCPSKDEYRCPKFYSEYEKYHPDKVLHQLTCHKEMNKKGASSPASVGDLSENTLQDMSSSRTFSPDSSQLKGDRTHPATKTGNILLGVVVTSLTSGALYRVNIKSLIIIYRILFFKIFLYYIAIKKK